MRGVDGVCDMCMCLARGWVEAVGVTGLGMDFTNSGGTWKSGVCVLVAVVWVVLGESGWVFGPGSGRVGWCYVCVCCESGFSVLMAGPGSPLCTLSISAS